MLNQDRGRLRTRLALGGEPADGLRKLDLDLGQKNLFTALVAKPQSVWLNEAGYRQFRDLCLEAGMVLGTGGRVVENPQQ